MKCLALTITLFILSSCAQNEYNANTTDKSNSTTTSPDIIQLRDTTMQFLWREMVYDSTLNDSISSLAINQDYISTATSPEKAALGYVATFIGNECWWDGKAKEDRSNLSCKILTALDLGYQCSENHLGFLKRWFSEDDAVLATLKRSNCPTIPYTSTNQNRFNEIQLFVTGDTISVFSKINGINVRDQISSTWSESYYFIVKNNNLRLINSDRSDRDINYF